MSQGSDAADQMVKETIAVAEMAVKLAGSGAKNLLVLLTLYAKENHQLKGETNLKKLIKEGKELRVFYLDNDDLAEFKNYAKEYGILYKALKHKGDESPITDILVKAEDTPRVNRILEKMNYPLPSERENEKEGESHAKKSPSAVRSEKGEKLSRLHIEIQSAHRFDVPVGFAKSRRFENFFLHRSSVVWIF